MNYKYKDIFFIAGNLSQTWLKTEKAERQKYMQIAL